MQTGASALLAAASIATLYSLVHFFDLFRRYPTVEVEAQRIEFEPPVPVESRPVRQAAIEPRQAAIEPRLVVDNLVEDAERVQQAPPVEEMAPPAKSQRRAKTPRKGAVRAKTARSAKDVEFTSTERSNIQVPTRADGAEAVEPKPQEETSHPPVAPLFEPEPFVRQQQRAMFGRKAG